MNSKVLLILAALVVIALGLYFYTNNEKYSNLKSIEIVSDEIIPQEKQIEISSAEIDTKYDANFVLNNLKREEFTLTLYLSNLSDSEAPQISDSDIYAYISDGNKNIFGTSSVSKYSEGNDKIAVAIIMDYSGSMEYTIPELQRAVQNFISNFQGNDLAEIIKFGDNIDRVASFTSDKNTLTNALFNQSFTRGGTALFSSVDEGLNDLSSIDKYYSKAVVAFTDGQDNVSNVTCDFVTDKAKKSMIPIFTVGLQLKEFADQYPKQFLDNLKGLSYFSGGFNYMTGDPVKLTELYKRINNSIRNSYTIKIKWDSNRLPPSGTNANLFVRVMSGSKAIASVNKSVVIP